MKTLVIGLGNPILTDDGVGIHIARAVHQALPSDAPVIVQELSVGGLSLMEAMIGYERVILIDALWTPEGETGQVIEFDAGQLSETLNTASAHDVGLPMALKMGHDLGAKLPARENIQIIAVTAHHVLEFSENMTPAVEVTVPLATRKVLNLLGYPRSDR